MVNVCVVLEGFQVGRCLGHVVTNFGSLHAHCAVHWYLRARHLMSRLSLVLTEGAGAWRMHATLEIALKENSEVQAVSAVALRKKKPSTLCAAPALLQVGATCCRERARPAALRGARHCTGPLRSRRTQASFL